MAPCPQYMRYSMSYECKVDFHTNGRCASCKWEMCAKLERDSKQREVYRCKSIKYKSEVYPAGRPDNISSSKELKSGSEAKLVS